MKCFHMELYYNATPSSSTGISPHEAVYGTAVRTPLMNSVEESKPLSHPTLEDHISKLKDIWNLVRRNMQKAQQVYTDYADTRRRDNVFAVGDRVLLSTQNLKLKGVQSKKLYPKFVGPYKIV